MNFSDCIYLDNAASAPLDPRVAARMAESLADPLLQGNPSSQHAHGQRARAAVEAARASCARLVGVPPTHVVFTSGATEANNLAIQGTVRAAATRGRHVVSARIEHKSVLDPLRQLQREGCAVTWLECDADGIVPPERLAAALRPETVLVSLMRVNNETGVVQPTEAYGAICRERGVALHVDAVQGVGKLDCNPQALGATLLSFSAHKLHGPKGIGALVLAPAQRASMQPLLQGGGQEWGLRSGTLAVHQIIGFGLAAELAAAEASADGARISALRERLWRGLAELPGVLLNGHPRERAPGILNVSFDGIDGESLLAELPMLAVSTGSACDSANADGSYVLRALGRSAALAASSLRLSLGRFSTADDVDRALAELRRAVTRLHALAP